MGRWLVVLVTLSGCGRVAFDPRSDAQPDGPPFAMRGDCEGYDTALFCDGFEDTSLAKWSVVSGETASMQLATPVPPHGLHVLEIIVDTRPIPCD